MSNIRNINLLEAFISADSSEESTVQTVNSENTFSFFSGDAHIFNGRLVQYLDESYILISGYSIMKGTALLTFSRI